MSAWIAIILGSAAVFSWKLFGYLLPNRLLESKFLTRLAGFITIALLMGLVGVQTFVGDSDGSNSAEFVFDARSVALLAAALLLALRAPFIVVVLAAASIAALVRIIG